MALYLKWELTLPTTEFGEYLANEVTITGERFYNHSAGKDSPVIYYLVSLRCNGLSGLDLSYFQTWWGEIYEESWRKVVIDMLANANKYLGAPLVKKLNREFRDKLEEYMNSGKFKVYEIWRVL